MALEFFIRNLCTEIQQVSKKEDIDCHQNFLIYYLTLLAYDPLWNLFPKMKEIVRLDALRLINFVVMKMRSQQCPCIVALKMQFYFQCNFESQDDIVIIEKDNFRTRLKPLLDDIVDAKPENDLDYDVLFKKIIYYCTLWRGLGNPCQQLVYQEAYHAMKSILDHSDMDEFISGKPDDKYDDLVQFASICGGVRIFNWSTKKSGQGIEDLPILLTQLMSAFKADVSRRLEANMDKIDILTSAIDYSFIIEPIEVTDADGVHVEYKQSCLLPEGIEYEEIEYFKDLIIVFRQIEGFSRKMLDANDELEITFEQMNEHFQDCIERFHSLAGLKSGVPTSVIFPLFVELDDIWQEYQNEIIFEKKMQQILYDLEFYVKDFYLSYEKLEAILDDRDILTDTDRLHVDDTILNDMFGLKVITPHNEAFAEMTLEFLGFDVWRLVESQGALIPGNPNLGIVVHEQKYYVFSCKESAIMFCQDPQRHTNEALELARKKTELIPLLQLQDALSEVQTIKQLVIDKETTQSNVKCKAVSTQSEVHPIPVKLDNKYMWNVWNYKREAIRLTDMSQRKTQTVNTDKKAGNYSVCTQTYDQKDQTNQTRRDNYANTHKPQTYFFGLRGRRDDKQFVLDLTKPPEKS